MAIKEIALNNANANFVQATTAQNTETAESDSCKTEWITEIYEEILCYLEGVKDKKDEEKLKREAQAAETQDEDDELADLEVQEILSKVTNQEDAWVNPKALQATANKAPCNSPANPVNFALNQVFNEEKFVDEVMWRLPILRDRYTNNVAKPAESHVSKVKQNGWICVSEDPADCFSMLCRAKGQHVLEPLQCKTQSDSFESNGFPSVAMSMDDLGFANGNEVDSWRIVEILKQFDITG